MLDALPSKVLVLRSGRPTEPCVAPTGELADRVERVLARRATRTRGAPVPRPIRNAASRAMLYLESVLCTWLCNGMHVRCAIVSRSRHELGFRHLLMQVFQKLKQNVFPLQGMTLQSARLHRHPIAPRRDFGR